MYGLKTLALLAALMALFLTGGYALGGQSGMLLALVLGSGMNFVMYFFSDKIVLKMYKARIVTEQEAPDLYRMVDALRQRAGLPMPTLAIAPHDQPNAFATGRSPDHAVVAVTTGLLKHMPPTELAGVLAHELAHVKNRDMLITTVAAGIAGAISYIGYIAMFAGGRREGGHPIVGLLMLILAPMAAAIIQMAVSRQREYKADKVGAEILGNPDPLARALARLGSLSQRIPMDVAPAAAPLAQVNPLAAHGGGMAGLFSTHPPLEERIARLEALARTT